MKLIEILKSNKPSISFEVFPPKTSETYSSVEEATESIAKLSPSFISVTYGASGGRSQYTIPIAANLQKKYKMPMLSHLTCATSNKKDILEQIKFLKENNIKNVLALRGDKPEGMVKEDGWDFKYASELIEIIKANGDFCIGGACYPEGHVESQNYDEDIYYLKKKVDAGCEFLITQMFFDNNILYNYLHKIREKGINVPVVAGIMPVTNAKQIKRICQISGTELPFNFKRLIDKFGSDPEAMSQAGIAYATNQIVDLFANNVNHIHVYTMNKEYIAKSILNNLSHILKNV